MPKGCWSIFPSACELLCRRPPLFQRGGMGIYAVFPKDMLRYAVSLKKMTLLSVTCSLCVRMKTLIMWGGISTNVLKAKDSLVKRQPDCWIIFREAGARRIYGFVEDDNIRSKRLCERLGMRREGCFKEFVTFVNNPDGSPKYEDTCVYAILEKEWNTIRQW